MKNHFVPFAGFFLLAASLAGCASFQSHPIVPADTASVFEARTLHSAGLKQFLERNLGREAIPWPASSWNLETLTLAAFYYNPDLDVARAKWGVAEAGMITAGARPNPTLGISAKHNNDAPDGVSPWTLGWNLDITIETAGKRGYRLEHAQHLSEAARFNIASVAWQVRSQVRANLLELSGARKSEALLSQEEAIQKDLVGLLERRLASGDISLPIVTQARIALEQTRLALRDAQMRSSEALARLASAIGLPASALEGVSLSLEDVIRIPADAHLTSSDVRRQALLNRADILAALAEYEASQSALRTEIAKQYPDIGLGPGYLWDAGQVKWSLGLSLAPPILNRNEGPIAQTEARRTQAAATFIALQAKAIGEIDLALRSYRAALEKTTAAETVLASQKRYQQSVGAQFNAGEADRLSLLSARLELSAAGLARLQTVMTAQQALGRLEDAMQRPAASEPPLSAMIEKTPRTEEPNP